MDIKQKEKMGKKYYILIMEKYIEKEILIKIEEENEHLQHTMQMEIKKAK